MAHSRPRGDASPSTEENDPAAEAQPRPRRLRLLFLLPFAPRLDARHGGRATAGVVARLAARHDVGVLHLRAADEAPADVSAAQRCAFLEEVVIPNPHGPRRRALRLWSLARGRPLEVADSTSSEFHRRARTLVESWRPDLVHLEMERMGEYLGSLGEAPPPRVLVAVEAAGAAALDRARTASGAERLSRYLDARAWRRFEAATLEKLDAIVCHTERDRRALASLAPRTPIETIPLRIELPAAAFDPVGAQPPTLLFVGGFGHTPNVDAAVHLATQIFPRVKARCPAAVLLLVGDQPPRAVRRLSGEDVLVTGPVEDVTPYLERAAVVAAPLRQGGGMRVKVLEALAAGKAVVASPLAAEGIEPGEHLLVAETDDELAAALAELLLNPDERAALGRRAREWAEASLDWQHTISAYEELYVRVLSRYRAASGD